MRHLAIGGSSFSRTLACPGWIKASAKLPKGTPGPAAITGSMHHMVQELVQGPKEKYAKPEDCLGLTYNENGVTRQFLDSDLATANIITHHTDELLNDLDIDEFMLEPFVQFWPGKAGGSIDILGLSKDRKTLLVADYKTGRVRVPPDANDQLLLYTISAATDPATKDLFEDVEKIVLAIVQPTAKGVVSVWECDMDYIIKYMDRAMDAINATKHKTPALNPGPECKWCPAAPYCKKRKADVIATKGLQPTDKKELQASADILEEVEAWVNATKSEMYTQLTRGTSIKGWKLVDKKAIRKWVDETAASAAFQQANIDPALFTKNVMLTAPQTTAAFKRAKLDLDELEIDLDDHIEAKSSGTTMAPEDDDREAVATGGVPDNLKKLVGKK